MYVKSFLTVFISKGKIVPPSGEGERWGEVGGEERRGEEGGGEGGSLKKLLTR